MGEPRGWCVNIDMGNINSTDLLHTERVVFRTDTANRLFPGRVRSVAAFDYYGESQLAASGDGDFFDFISLPSNALITALGDVSGQNAAAAALLIPGIRTFLRSRMPVTDTEIANVVRDLNRTVCDVSADGLYATLFFADFDPARRLLRYVNAAHEPALLLREGGRTVQHLGSTGTVLGLTTRSVYGVRSLTLEPGDTLVAFTDGVVESADGSGRIFGEAGILHALRLQPDARAREMVAHLLNVVRKYTGSSVQSKDRTACVVRFNDVQENPLRADQVAEPAFAAA